jgi:hypothetical protein
MMKARLLLPALASIVVTGCTTPNASLDRVEATIAERTGKRLQWNRGGAEDAQIEQGVRALLQRELTADRAVQVALLNNRELQARLRK